ncbi:MAG: helix-turn-helix domain-containing protein [Pseudomonadota bacterium]
MLDVGVASEAEASNCPIRSVLSNVTGKWRMIIVLGLRDGPLRFAEIKRGVGDITQRVLTENLRALQRDGYLTRSVDPGPPIAVTYELTAQGHALVAALLPLVKWSNDIMPDVKAARAAYDGAAR